MGVTSSGELQQNRTLKGCEVREAAAAGGAKTLRTVTMYLPGCRPIVQQRVDRGGHRFLLLPCGHQPLAREAPHRPHALGAPMSWAPHGRVYGEAATGTTGKTPALDTTTK